LNVLFFVVFGTVVIISFVSPTFVFLFFVMCSPAR
jgi:hypothetical protein